MLRLILTIFQKTFRNFNGVYNKTPTLSLRWYTDLKSTLKKEGMVNENDKIKINNCSVINRFIGEFTKGKKILNKKDESFEEERKQLVHYFMTNLNSKEIFVDEETSSTKSSSTETSKEGSDSSSKISNEHISKSSKESIEKSSKSSGDSSSKISNEHISKSSKERSKTISKTISKNISIPKVKLSARSKDSSSDSDSSFDSEREKDITEGFKEIGKISHLKKNEETLKKTISKEKTNLKRKENNERVDKPKSHKKIKK
ncbi:hypothetical protein ACTFIW_010056 [Dictyostelium discoideum]